jgi:hypothetical protein
MCVADLMNSIQRNTASRAAAANVKLSFQVDPTLPECLLGDQHRIFQCVLNFCTNAIKFVSQDGSGSVIVRASVVRVRKDGKPPLNNKSRRLRVPSTRRGMSSVLSKDSPTSVLLADNEKKWLSTEGDGDGVFMRKQGSTASNAGGQRGEFFGSPISPTPKEVPTLLGINRGALRTSQHSSGLRDLSAQTPALSPAAPHQADLPPISPAILSMQSQAIGSGSPGEVIEITSMMSKSQSYQVLPWGQGDDLALLPFKHANNTQYKVDSTDKTVVPTTGIARVRFEVEDNGCGIGLTDMQNLWQPFVQIDAGIHQKGKGTGLGLYISNQIVEKHGGRVGASSKEGEGSTFWLEVPLRVMIPMTGSSDPPASNNAPRSPMGNFRGIAAAKRGSTGSMVPFPRSHSTGSESADIFKMGSYAQASAGWLPARAATRNNLRTTSKASLFRNFVPSAAQTLPDATSPDPLHPINVPGFVEVHVHAPASPGDEDVTQTPTNGHGATRLAIHEGFTERTWDSTQRYDSASLRPTATPETPAGMHTKLSMLHLAPEVSSSFAAPAESAAAQLFVDTSPQATPLNVMESARAVNHLRVLVVEDGKNRVAHCCLSDFRFTFAHLQCI